MAGPDLDKNGRVVRPPLLTFERFIEQGMSCIVRLVIDDASKGDLQTVQFSLTLEQCREIAANLMIAAQVIELERPTAPNELVQ
ncbi:hypothetical protein [Neorhizobium sp. DT-125]|uniref:hypothetical protein n=1 Tax=Neorhizobium sp. DT-125 TaxID=3396163 RepID=UPI003F1DD951